MSAAGRWRLRPGVVTVDAGDGIILSSAFHTRVIRGGQARQVIREVASRLDGTRGIDDIARDSGIPAGRVSAALTLLRESALLEQRESIAGREMAETDQHSAAFASLYLDDTRIHSRPSEPIGDIATASVLIIGRSPVADAIAADLGAAGLGSIAAARPGATDPGALASPPAPLGTLVIYVDAGDRAGRRLAEACADAGLSLLRVAVTPGSAELGPLFARPLTACLDCLDAARRQAAWPSPVIAGLPGWQVSLAAGLAVNEALALTAGLTVPISFRSIHRVLLDDFTWDRLMLVPELGCPRCGPAGPHHAGPAELSRRYEWVVEDRPSEPWHLKLGAVTAEGMSTSVDRMSVRRQYPTCPARDLPARESDRLISVIERVAGRKPGHGDEPGYPLRWAPSAGNLASAEIHIVTPQPGQLGLPGNVAKYDDVGRRLIAVRNSPAEMHELLRGSGLTAERLEALIVVSAAITRVKHKYDIFSYRLVHLDTGFAVTQLVATATERGYHVRVAPSWDDAAVTAALDLRPPTELITALAGLYQESSQCPS